MIKRWFTKGNLFNAALIIIFAVLVFNPSAKAFLIRGLMQVGLFKPDVGKAVPVSDIAAADIAFMNAKRQTLRVNQLKGKVVVINFWATWCPPCIAEMPSLNKLHQKFKDNPRVVFITVDADGDLDKSAYFMAENKYTLPLYRVNSEIPQTLFGGSLPTTVFLDKTGQMVLRHEGAANYDSDKVLAYLNQLAAK
jgi:thiol-disulfide isomerase/thioredoxin